MFPNNVIVEIGAYLGRSTCFICEGINNKNIDFYSIDTFENQEMTEGFRETLSIYHRNTYLYRNKIHVIKGFSYDVVNDFKNIKIDLLWIDADHRYKSCKRDIEDWLPLVKKKGYIVFHDYIPHLSNKRVKRAVDEKIKERKIAKVKRVDQLLITKKI